MFVQKLVPTQPSDSSPKEIRTEVKEADLIQGSVGVWYTLDVHKIGLARWIPIRQVSLIGFKGDHHIVTVTATGLKSHMTLAEVLCQGVFAKTRARE